MLAVKNIVFIFFIVFIIFFVFIVFIVFKNIVLWSMLEWFSTI